MGSKLPSEDDLKNYENKYNYFTKVYKKQI